MEEIFRVVDKHVDYWEALAAEGKVLAAGPLLESDSDRWYGIGRIIVEATSEDEAKQLAEGDPMHQEGVCSWTITPWLVIILPLLVLIDKVLV